MKRVAAVAQRVTQRFGAKFGNPKNPETNGGWNGRIPILGTILGEVQPMLTPVHNLTLTVHSNLALKPSCAGA